MTKKKRVAAPKRNEILVKEREDNWRITPSAGIPKYRAESDPLCPAGQMKKYNDEKRLNAKLLAEQEKRGEKWSKVSLENNFKDVPVKINPSLRYKAMESFGPTSKNDAMAEVEILQKIIVREGLLAELHKLLKTQNEINSCLGEVSELVKALRYQTLDIIEDISAWQDVQAVPRPFLYKGLNYLVKVKCDLDFLDLYDEITERFCFEFKSNPLAYRDGGNIISGYNFDKTEYNKALLKKSSNQMYVDGIEITRLKNAEKIIQNEFNRLGADKNFREGNNLENELPTSFHHNEGPKRYENNQLVQVSSNKVDKGGVLTQKVAKAKVKRVKSKQVTIESPAANDVSNNDADMKFYYEKTPKKNFNPRKIKLERILTLEEEASELKAMMTHVEEKVKVLFEQGKDISEKRKLYAIRMKEAQAQGKETASQHIAAEISVLTAKLQDLQIQIKNLQREGYFISLERKRKLGVRQKLKDEMAEEKKRETLKKTIEDKIKKEGLMSVLQALTDSKSLEQITQIAKETDISRLSEKRNASSRKNRERRLVHSSSSDNNNKTKESNTESTNDSPKALDTNSMDKWSVTGNGFNSFASDGMENSNVVDNGDDNDGGDEDDEEGNEDDGGDDEEDGEDDEEENDDMNENEERMNDNKERNSNLQNTGNDYYDSTEDFFSDKNHEIYGNNSTIGVNNAYNTTSEEAVSPSGLSISPNGSVHSSVLSKHSNKQSSKDFQSRQGTKSEAYISDDDHTPKKEIHHTLSFSASGSALCSPFENLHSSRKNEEDMIQKGDETSQKSVVLQDTGQGNGGSVGGDHSLNCDELRYMQDHNYNSQDEEEEEDGDDGEEEEEEEEEEGDEEEEGEEEEEEEEEGDVDLEEGSSYVEATGLVADNHESLTQLSQGDNYPVGSAVSVAKARKASPRNFIS